MRKILISHDGKKYCVLSETDLTVIILARNSLDTNAICLKREYKVKEVGFFEYFITYILNKIIF